MEKIFSEHGPPPSATPKTLLSLAATKNTYFFHLFFCLSFRINCFSTLGISRNVCVGERELILSEQSVQESVSFEHVEQVVKTLCPSGHHDCCDYDDEAWYDDDSCACSDGTSWWDDSSASGTGVRWSKGNGKGSCSVCGTPGLREDRPLAKTGEQPRGKAIEERHEQRQADLVWQRLRRWLRQKQRWFSQRLR